MDPRWPSDLSRRHRWHPSWLANKKSQLHCTPLTMPIQLSSHSQVDPSSNRGGKFTPKTGSYYDVESSTNTVVNLLWSRFLERVVLANGVSSPLRMLKTLPSNPRLNELDTKIRWQKVLSRANYYSARLKHHWLLDHWPNQALTYLNKLATKPLLSTRR